MPEQGPRGLSAPRRRRRSEGPPFAARAIAESPSTSSTQRLVANGATRRQAEPSTRPAPSEPSPSHLRAGMFVPACSGRRMRPFGRWPCCRPRPGSVGPARRAHLLVRSDGNQSLSHFARANDRFGASRVGRDICMCGQRSGSHQGRRRWFWVLWTERDLSCCHVWRQSYREERWPPNCRYAATSSCSVPAERNLRARPPRSRPRGVTYCLGDDPASLQFTDDPPWPHPAIARRTPFHHQSNLSPP